MYSQAQPMRADQIRIIDGDTIAVSGLGANMRLVGFNTPETTRAACKAEKGLGGRATARLRQLVPGAAEITLKRVACACKPGTEGTTACNYGRFYSTLSVDSVDVGEILIREKLAVPYLCGRTSCPPRPGNWCGP